MCLKLRVIRANGRPFFITVLQVGLGDGMKNEPFSIETNRMCRVAGKYGKTLRKIAEHEISIRQVAVTRKEIVGSS